MKVKEDKTMTLTTIQVRQIRETMEKHFAKSNSLRWTMEFDGGEWCVRDDSGGLVTKFPEVPEKADLNTMVRWGTATARENMGALWRSQLEYLAAVVIPEAFHEILESGHSLSTQAAQSRQAQQ
jgi:hypothetical protein